MLHSVCGCIQWPMRSHSAHADLSSLPPHFFLLPTCSSCYLAHRSALSSLVTMTTCPPLALRMLGLQMTITLNHCSQDHSLPLRPNSLQCAESQHVPALNCPPPWIACDVHLVVFYTKCPSSTHYALFELNHPILVLAMVDNTFMHAFYRMVRAINVWSDSDPHKVKYTVTVEVHIPPNFKINWSNTIPWPGVLHYIPFLHPHAFLADGYYPILLADTPTGNMSIARYDALNLSHMIALEHHKFHSLSPSNMREHHITANTTPHPPIILSANMQLEHSKFILMIITPDSTDETVSTPHPASPSTLSDEEVNQFRVDGYMHLALGGDCAFNDLPWQV